jgi:8-oxo-dGTP diphosphatase
LEKSCRQSQLFPVTDGAQTTQRSAVDKLPLMWEFPGGKVEDGETPEECLKREIKEELNLNIKVGSLVATSRYNYTSGEIILLAYNAEIISGVLQLKIHYDARWVVLDELRHYEFCPADMAIIKTLIEAER